MSDFRIVKCKSCDAALVELTGEKLRSCVQCGYQFGLDVKNKLMANTQSSRRGTGHLETSHQQSSHRQTSQYDFGASSNEENNSQLSEQIQRIRKLGTNKKNQASTSSFPPSDTSTKRKKAAYVSPKKKSNAIGTIIFVIIAFNIVRGIFSS